MSTRAQTAKSPSQVLDNPYQIRHLKKRAFVAAYANSGNIRASCRAAEVARPTYYVWMERDDAFATAVHHAKEEYGDALVAKCTELAMREGNVTALIVALKMAGRFVDRVQGETTLKHTGPDGASVPSFTIRIDRAEERSPAGHA